MPASPRDSSSAPKDPGSSTRGGPALRPVPATGTWQGSAGQGGDGKPFSSRAFAVDVFRQLDRMSRDGEGISRETYGDGETKAMEYVASLARAEGLDVVYDAAANLVIELLGAAPDLPVVACGSHLDSVPQGGNFDGAAGVVAGLMAMIRMKRDSIVPPRTVRLYGLRGEESAWYGRCYLGSLSLFGRLPREDLDAEHRDTQSPLRDAMRASGVDLDLIEAGEPLVDPKDFAAFLELHIEQGPVMVARDLPLGIVTGIRGNIRHRNVVCKGEAGHSGAVPRWLRRDAVFATAELLSRIDEHWRVLLERGLDLVVTTGIMSTNPADHAITRIPGEARMSFEVRSQSIETLEAFHHLLLTECRAIGAERKVEFIFDKRIESKPARMDEKLVQRLLKACEGLGIPTEPIPSGAGHDAAVFANAGVPTAMIFVRNQGGSHNPREAMEIDDFLKGVDVLHYILQEDF